jgi:alpha-tubulin suppressor-like RCC1 family protein
VIALAVLGALAWLGGCSDEPGGPGSVGLSHSEGVFVSDPVTAAALTAESGAALALAPGAADDVVYVSLAPGTIPAGSLASVRRVGDPTSLTTAVTDGGFDPVPVPAQAGDSIDVVVTDAGGVVVLQQRVLVAAARPPVIVRTEPPPRKRDVPLNASLVIVFSEPMNANTLNSSSVQLLLGTTPVSGTVSLLGGGATAAVFIPAAPLEAEADYLLVVTQTVRDLGGDALAADLRVAFTTGSSSTGPVTTVTVLPASVEVLDGSWVQLTAIALAAIPHDTFSTTQVTGRPTTWSSDNPAVAEVSATGLVTARSSGTAHVQAVVDSVVGVATISVLAPFAAVSVSTGWAHTCAVTASGAAYCWGSNLNGQLGDGITTSSAIPVAVAGGLRFTSVSAGGNHSCGVTSTGAAYCWGGPFDQPAIPVAVAGGPSFTSVSAGAFHNCGVTSSGAAYCWGDNTYGQLGDGTTTNSSTPVAVAGGLILTSVSAGSHTPWGPPSTRSHTCGVTSTGAGYCWGYNGDGQLGDGTMTNSATPEAVAGGLSFIAVNSGGGYTCGVTSSSVVYCWGNNALGQLGDGTTTNSVTPVAVAGGRRFATVSVGWIHSCGITPAGAAYCWGIYHSPVGQVGGALGNGTTTGSLTPVPVAGGLSFSDVSAGGFGNPRSTFDPFTCGVTTTGATYCWGSNRQGRLGNGRTGGVSLVPQPVHP